jgi:hypothetical protein
MDAPDVAGGRDPRATESSRRLPKTEVRSSKMKSGAVLGMTLAAVAVACGSDGGGTPTTTEEKGGCSCLAPPSHIGVPLPVDWNSPTQYYGKTPAEALGAASGTCTASITWDATASDDLVVSPTTGASRVRVDVTVDQTSAGALSTGSTAPPWLTANAAVHVESDDGALVADGAATVSFDGHLQSLRFTIPADELGGSLSIKPKDARTGVQLAFEIGPLSDGCAGTVRIETAMAIGSNGGVGGSAPFASWSDTGCPAGQVSADVDESSILNAWAKKTYDGTWDDGTTTQIELAISTLPKSGCKDPTLADGDTTFMTNLAYDTTDGRVQRHSAAADGHVFGTASPELNTNEPFACATSSSSLPYTPADCGSFSRVLLELTLGFESGKLEVYEYGKNADSSTSAADSVHTLLFGAAP